MKTPQQWAEYLPEPIRTEFLENVDASYIDYNEYTVCLDDCIVSSFSWGDTSEKGQGFIYWDRIHDRALNGDFSTPLPTTPTEVKEESLEEAAKSFAITIQTKEETASRLNAISWFTAGAKWQLEQMKIKSQPTPTKEGNVTAVEWFWDKIKSHFEHDGDLLETATFTFSIAKEKEKEQIVKCCIDTTQSCWTSLMDGIGKPLVFTDKDLENQQAEAEQYYNETYGGEK